MNDKTKTAVEWLFDQLPEHLRLSNDGFDMLQQAKEIEREQIEEAYYEGKQNIPSKTHEEYYDQIYGKP
jgi:hypothetical protein